MHVTFNKVKPIDIFPWGMGFIPHNVFSWIENDDELVNIIQIHKVVYANPFKIAWDA
jgi:hypothetical protein